MANELRRFGANVAVDNGRVPATWTNPALGGAVDRVEQCLRRLRRAGVIPRREVGLMAWG